MSATTSTIGSVLLLASAVAVTWAVFQYVHTPDTRPQIDRSQGNKPFRVYDAKPNYQGIIEAPGDSWFPTPAQIKEINDIPPNFKVGY